MVLEEQHVKGKSKTSLTLENMLRMSFHPNGCKDFMNDMNTELELGPIQSSMNKKLGIRYDILKYILYAGALGLIAYDLIK